MAISVNVSFGHTALLYVLCGDRYHRNQRVTSFGFFPGAPSRLGSVSNTSNYDAERKRQLSRIFLAISPPIPGGCAEDIPQLLIQLLKLFFDGGGSFELVGG
jgi:hypothetical protein